MDVSIWVTVVVAAVAALAGAVATWVVLRRRVAKVAAQLLEANDRADGLEQARATAVAETARVQAVADEQRAAAETARADAVQLREQLDTAHAHLERVRAEGEESGRELRTFRERLRDVAGLESEIATLRVIAARVPLLEARLAELETGDLDLRSPSDRASDAAPDIAD